MNQYLSAFQPALLSQYGLCCLSSYNLWGVIISTRNNGWKWVIHPVFKLFDGDFLYVLQFDLTFKYLIEYPSIKFVRVLRRVLLKWQSSEPLHLQNHTFFSLAMRRKVFLLAFGWRNCFRWAMMSQEGKIWKDLSISIVPQVQLPFDTIFNPSSMIFQHPRNLPMLSTHFFLPHLPNSVPLNVEAVCF